MLLCAYIFSLIIHHRLTGTIPGMFCGEGAASMSMLYQENGCDAVLCRPGTFNTYGHATLYASCRVCPKSEEGEALDPPMSTVLGRTECNGTTFVHGDLNADGILSAREILRLIYVENLGRFWGAAYQSWANMKVGECDLSGVTCVKGNIHKIDLSAANLCSNGDRKPGPIVYCKGLPAEIGELSTLEILQVSRRQFLRGTLPTEIGKLSLLKFLDFSSCTSMKGNLPTELGLLTNLRYLILSHSRFQGTFPEEIFHIRSLEKIHITNNRFYGSLPTTLGLLENLKEFMLSRNYFTSSIPTEIGNLNKLENFEAYSNSMNGTLPEQMALCTNLKRIGEFVPLYPSWMA
jgi:Leucine-rich repeat (LRR) protein